MMENVALVMVIVAVALFIVGLFGAMDNTNERYPGWCFFASVVLICAVSWMGYK